MFDLSALSKFQDMLPKVESFLNIVLTQIKNISDEQIRQREMLEKLLESKKVK